MARRALRREDGAALVELALVLPVLAVLLFGLIDFGRAFNYWIDETHLANQGARWAIVNKNPGFPTYPTLQDYIRSQATTNELRNGGSDAIPTAMSVDICYPNGSKNVGDPIRLTASVEYNWLPLFGSGVGITTTTLRASATMRLEQKPTLPELSGAPACA